MKTRNTEIHWSQATENIKNDALLAKKEKETRETNLEKAHAQFMDSLSRPGFSFDKFEEACMDHGVDQDELFHRLI
ncbi:hypothetical protein [Maribacter polysaccharolyticus]|uniref:hypothetical protein n=1 Tax=Maribacter polysaccharolyticus TaxID=3020831 RepID=UPI00237FA678|nr:hypothetical protein [Maribacter polysaccharolyticus]MDE3744011.1 hypothetical protein [Maribacter polysaccharolyticus]